jgi:hypothetical protein
MMTVESEPLEFPAALKSPGRSPELSDADDVYGWLCGSWDLQVVRYRGIDVSGQQLHGEVHAGWVLEGRAIQDVWIMPRRGERRADADRSMNMFGTTLRSWDPTIRGWRIAWTNPVSGHYEQQVGRWNGKDILQEGVRGDGTRTRWTFTEITAGSFHWKGEAQYPNQPAWAVEGEFLAIRRVLPLGTTLAANSTG